MMATAWSPAWHGLTAKAGRIGGMQVYLEDMGATIFFQFLVVESPIFPC